METQRTVLKAKFLSISTTDHVDWVDGSRGDKSILITMGLVGSVSVLLTLRRLYASDNGMLETTIGLSAELRRMVRVSAPRPRSDEAAVADRTSTATEVQVAVLGTPARTIDLTDPGSRAFGRTHPEDIFEARGPS